MNIIYIFIYIVYIVLYSRTKYSRIILLWLTYINVNNSYNMQYIALHTHHNAIINAEIKCVYTEYSLTFQYVTHLLYIYIHNIKLVLFPINNCNISIRIIKVSIIIIIRLSTFPPILHSVMCKMLKMERK